MREKSRKVQKPSDEYFAKLEEMMEQRRMKEVRAL